MACGGMWDVIIMSPSSPRAPLWLQTLNVDICLKFDTGTMMTDVKQWARRGSSGGRQQCNEIGKSCPCTVAVSAEGGGGGDTEL
jgi:hypothetical protein